MKKLLIIQLIILFNFMGCVKQEDNCLPVTIDLLQGDWIDYCNECHAFGGRQYNFTFVGLSDFKMKKYYFTDALNPNCNGDNSWNTYAKGKITLDDKLISLNGFYCDENYNKLEHSNCYEIVDTGSFKMEFDNFHYCNDTLVLQNTNLSDWHGLIKLKRK